MRWGGKGKRAILRAGRGNAIIEKTQKFQYGERWNSQNYRQFSKAAQEKIKKSLIFFLLSFSKTHSLGYFFLLQGATTATTLPLWARSPARKATTPQTVFWEASWEEHATTLPRNSSKQQ